MGVSASIHEKNCFEFIVHCYKDELYNLSWKFSVPERKYLEAWKNTKKPQSRVRGTCLLIQSLREPVKLNKR